MLPIGGKKGVIIIIIRADRKTRPVFSLLLAMVLILGTFIPSAYGLAGEPKEVARNKLDHNVLDVLDSEDYIEVLVYLKDRVDTNNVAKATRNSLSSTTTPYEVKLRVRENIVEALQDKAEKTQVNLLRYIAQENERGNVKKYKPYYIINMVYVKATKDVIENIAYMPEVEKIYKNGFIEIEGAIKDKIDVEPAETGGLEWNIEKVGADKVWDMGIDGTGSVVGIIDTGVAWNHPALKEKWRGYDPETGKTNPRGNWFDAIGDKDMPYDIPNAPHGTHVLGTILGQEPDGSNKIGVAPGARWIAAKAFGASGGYDNDIIMAGQWMLAPNGVPANAPDVVNNSWGGASQMDDWYREIINNWRAAGIVPVFAAGNQETGGPLPGPGSIENPANYPESFAVAAVDKDNKRASFSKLGPSRYDTTLIKPEISAPGVNIRSSVPDDEYEGGWNGTSMATSHVTGTVALMVSANNLIGIDEIEQIIKDTATGLADEIYTESPNFGYGYGLINAFKAVSSVVSDTGTGLITGKVLVGQEDSEDPVIMHEQEIKEAYIGSDIEITANISDDVFVAEAELLVKTEDEPNWKPVKMERVSGNYKDGVYKATITHDLLGDTITIYRLRAKDYNGNVAIAGDYYINIKPGIVPDEYETDFETQPVGWKLTGDWEWGRPKEGIGPTPYKGTKLVGTVLSGQYSADSDSLLVTPPIDLSDNELKHATLKFYQWYKIRDKYDNDKGRIYISDDYGENWVPVGPEYKGNSYEWHEALVNLEEYIGSPTPIFVGFHFISDNYGEEDGWYIDSVSLIGKDEKPPATPTGLMAEVTLAGIKLTWEPSPEVDFRKYNIYRSEIPDGKYVEMGSEFKTFFIDDTAEGGKVYYYTITAVDISGNESKQSEAVCATAPDVTIVFNTNFKDDNGGFITGVIKEGKNNCWEWGVPTSGPGRVSPVTRVWATNLSGDYDANSDGYIESPSITIPDNVEAALFFDHWIDTEMQESGYLWDYGQVWVSADGGENWIEFEKMGGHVRDWKNKEIGLGAYIGQTIKIRFVFHSDSQLNYEGWYIDNVLVSGVEKSDTDKVSVAESIVTEEYADKEIKEDKVPKERTRLRDPGLDPGFSLVDDKTSGYETAKDILIKKTTLGGIPADAVVTVVETGKNVRTDPATGEFFMRHAANEKGGMWTLRAESYGCYPREIKVHLEKDEELREIIFLNAIPRGTVSGKVFDESDGTPIANAVISIKEDPKIAPVRTDETGDFKIEGVLEGTYTLKVKADWFYESREIEIIVLGGQVKKIKILLKKSIKYEDEIAYDDNLPKDDVVMSNANEGIAVRFTPPRCGKVTGTCIYFSDYTSTDGTEIGVAIFDTDVYGEPEMVAKPKVVNINRGEWNTIDLSEYNFATDRDFYIATVQTQAKILSPAVGIATSTAPGEIRSYLHTDGKDLTPITGVSDALMIRANMEYSANVPEITNLGEINYTNQDEITVEGKVETDGKVNIYVNSAKVAEPETKDKIFSAEINLDDESIITATSELKGVETAPSSPVKVVKDKVAPILEVTKPFDGEKTNAEVIHVAGNVFDEYPDRLLINEKEVDIDGEGNFDAIIILSEGENTIIIKAIDLAANETVETRRVMVKLKSAVPENIEPAEDIVLKAGDVLTVSFSAETGGTGSFVIIPEIVTFGQTSGIPMTESADIPGLYRGTWTIPEGFNITDGIIETEFVDMVGNKTVRIAPGRVTVVSKSEYRLMENLPPKTVIIGREAFSIMYLNSNATTQEKLIDLYRQGEEIYIKPDKDIIVNIRGAIQGSDVLPEGLIYYDANGNTAVYLKQTI